MATEKRLIDANELVDTIYKSDEMLHSDEWETCEIVDQIDRIPTVDAVEVVHGLWEPREDVKGFVRCSVCHDCNIYDEWPDGKKWNYCPNCGADMRERKDYDL